MPFAPGSRGAHGLGWQRTRAGSGKALKILFSALHFANFRNFESAIVELARRGHDVHLIADEPESLGGEHLVARLVAASPRITSGWAPAVVDEPWFPPARKLRHGLEFVRFLDPRFDRSPKLRLRTADRAPRLVAWLGAVPGLRRTPLRRAVAAALSQIERLLPPSERDVEFLRAVAPDVLLVTSLTYPRAPQIDHLKAARRLGIPVGACILSWDHLSSKAPIHLLPDRVFVWNEVQQREAVALHSIPRHRVVVTGAQCYDQWFDRAPGEDRDAFCRALGFDPARPLVLYVASAMSPAPSPPEPAVVATWLRALRTSPDERLRRASVLIRPHPERTQEWSDFDPTGLGPVVVRGGSSLATDGKTQYFDTLFHSTAVVGVCTTAFIEAAIVGRPVLALSHPAFRVHQEAMAHFRYLVEVEGGILQMSDTLEAHLSQLGSALAPVGGTNRHARFLRAFIRPDGLDAAATPRFADAVETLARERPAPPVERAPWYRPLLVPVARHLAAHGTHGVTRWVLIDAVETKRERFERSRMRSKERAKRARARNPRKQIARLKTQIKRSLGLPVADE